MIERFDSVDEDEGESSGGENHHDGFGWDLTHQETRPGGLGDVRLQVVALGLDVFFSSCIRTSQRP